MIPLFRYGKRTSVVFVAAVLLAGWLHSANLFAASTISYVQGNYATPQTPQASVTVPFSGQQRAGDLNVVVVGWNDTTATVSSVADNSGNPYYLAVGPTTVSGYLSQSIYYAKNIASAAAGANSVTVNFSTAAVYPDIRILEYYNADQNLPVDVTATGAGNSATSASAPVTTTNAVDLIFGANIVLTTTQSAGTGFTQRLLTSPDGDIAEDKMVTRTGSYSTTAPLSSSGPWIMQMVAFRTPAAASAPPTVTSVTPNIGSTAGGTSVTITGTNFGSGATVTFGGVAATNVVVVSGTSITAVTPANAAGAVTVTVTVNGLSGSLSSGFTYLAPTVSSVSPGSGPIGTLVTITGANFGSTQGSSTVTFNGVEGTPSSWSDTSITVPVPVGATSGSVVVTVNGLASNASPFSVTTSTTTALSSSPNPSTYGTAVTFTATVTPSTATGTVTFMYGSTQLGTGSLNGGTATLTLSWLPVGSDSITAVYGGDANDVGSTSPVYTQTVNAPTVTKPSYCVY